MRRVCFIGNSYVAAIKKALDDLKGNIILDDIDVSIFGSHSDSLKTLNISEGYIFSDDDFVQKNFHWTSGGSTKVKISDFNEIFIVMGPSFFDFRAFEAGNDIPFISSDLAMNIMKNKLDQWPMRIAMSAANENNNVRVTHIGAPFRSAEAPKSKLILARFNDPKSRISSRIENLRTLMEEKSTEVSEGNFRVMKPLTSTLEEHGLFTQHIFCQGSIRLTEELNIKHPTNDYGHMNANYGRLLLEHLLA